MQLAEMFEVDRLRSDCRRSICASQREDFFAELAQSLSWFTPWQKVLDSSDLVHPKWFCGGTLNLCYNALDRHVEAGLGERTALIYDSPRTGQVTNYTYAQLLEQTVLVAGILRDECGVSKGDPVVIFMPKVVETVVALLACARLGALTCTVYGGMSPSELAKKIDHCQAKAVVSASGGLVAGRLFDFKAALDQALKQCRYTPSRCLVLLRQGMGSQELCEERDLDWSQCVSTARPCVECEPLEANEPLYLFYTSGTTGEPKGVLLPACYCLTYRYCPSQYIRPPGGRHVYLTTSEFGWILAMYYTVVMPLLSCNTAVLFEGASGPGGSSGHWPRLVSQHGVTVAVSCNAPFRELRQKDPEHTFREKFNINSLCLVLLGGECADEDLLRWIAEAFSCVTSDCYGQTELMHVTGCVQLPDLPNCRRHFPSAWPTIGLDVNIVKEDGELQEPGSVGRICMRPPLRPGALLTTYKNDQYFQKEYFQSFPGFYDTKDSGRILPEGQLQLYGRDDDVIIMDGSRIHGNFIEQEIRRLDGVGDCAVVAGPNPDHWEEPVAFVVFLNGLASETSESESLRLLMKERFELAALSVVPVVQLPATRSGKVSRTTLKDLLHKNGVNSVSLAFRNPDAVEHIHSVIQKLREANKMPQRS